MEKITKDIKKAIEDNLSGQVAGVLKDVISHYEILKEQCEEQKEVIKDLQNDVALFSKRENEFNSVSGKLLQLETLQDNLTERERNLRIKLLEHELKCSKESNLQIHGLVGQLMKNPRSIELINQTKWKDGSYYTDQYGNSVQNPGTSSDITGTIEKIQTKGDNN